MVDIAALAAQAAAHDDQTREVSHEDFNNVPAEGLTVGRLVSYIELGVHDGGMYQGKKKPDAEKVRIEFELLGPDNIIKFEKDGKEVEIGQMVSITLKKSLSDKAKFKKLFNKLQYGREDKTHIAQMLGEAFLITVFHNKDKDASGKERTFVNLDKDGEFGIMAPFKVDAITKQRQAYDIRPHTAPLRLFLWDIPVKEMWDSLFIDGTREIKKEDGTKETKSKNWLQEAILSAKNFQGSALHAMLTGVSADDLEAAEAEIQQAAEQIDLEQAIAETEKPAESVPADPAPDVPAEPETPAEPADPLAALGLTLK